MKIQKIYYQDTKHGGYGANIVQTTVIDDNTRKMITFYREGKDYGSEIYVGENYIVNSSRRSYSRNYNKLKNLPNKYKSIVQDLIVLHKKRYG